MTGEQLDRYVYDCMVNKGWDVTPSENGGLLSEGDASQTGQFNADWSACNAPIRDAAVPVNEWSQESWDELYQKVLTEAECLQELGYDVQEAPSREVFIEDTIGGHQWTPWGVIVGSTPSPGVDPLAACPQADFIPRRG
ncbi:hypothetical protein [Brooklawnia cerclae]|uniref:Uncharacterized protein n=1 Tax=Brooklawnia cerclae TaxID=349934 RepID=A0ABX0SE88_9ACTN|nr:hypothetical protein [Brooklawnia cerclae]NIH56679.1 hypothetical protein [Brooklawnia cerclae]